MKRHKLTYRPSDVAPYINWPYFYHAWQVKDKDEQELLSRALQQVLSAPVPQAVLTYFAADAYKDGGRYETRTAVIKRLDSVHQQLLLEDGTRIDLSHIVRIQPT